MYASYARLLPSSFPQLHLLEFQDCQGVSGECPPIDLSTCPPCDFASVVRTAGHRHAEHFQTNCGTIREERNRTDPACLQLCQDGARLSGSVALLPPLTHPVRLTKAGATSLTSRTVLASSGAKLISATLLSPRAQRSLVPTQTALSAIRGSNTACATSRIRTYTTEAILISCSTHADDQVHSGGDLLQLFNLHAADVID